MKQDELKNVYVWVGDKSSFDFPTKPKANHEFLSILNLKEHFFKTNKKCAFCHDSVFYDIWDLQINDVPIYKEPAQESPSVLIELYKSEGLIKAPIKILKSGSNIILLSFFDLLLQGLNAFPSTSYISKQDGFVTAQMFYDFDYGLCYFNRFRYGGLAKKEIIDVVNYLKNDFKKKANIHW